LDELLSLLDAALQANHPSLHATLQPGIDAPSGPSELKAWFRWRNGQPRGAVEAIHGTYRFVSYGDGRAELRHMRSTIWKSPLNAAIIAMFEPGAFHSIPLLTSPAGEGYYFNSFRRGVHYRSRGERHVTLDSFTDYLEILLALASRPTMAPGPAAECEYELLQRFS
jgi:hypothetical protein